MKTKILVAIMLVAFAQALFSNEWFPGNLIFVDDTSYPDEEFSDFWIEPDGSLQVIGTGRDPETKDSVHGLFFLEKESPKWVMSKQFHWEFNFQEVNPELIPRLFVGPNFAVASHKFNWNGTEQEIGFSPCIAGHYLDLLLFEKQLNWTANKIGPVATDLAVGDGIIVQDSNHSQWVGFLTDDCRQIFSAFVWNIGEAQPKILPKFKASENVTLANSISENGVIAGALFEGTDIFFEDRSFLYDTSKAVIWEKPYSRPTLLPGEPNEANKYPSAISISQNGNIVVGYDNDQLTMWKRNNNSWDRVIITLPTEIDPLSVRPFHVLNNGAIYGTRRIPGSSRAFIIDTEGSFVFGDEYLRARSIDVTDFQSFRRVRLLEDGRTAMLINAAPNGVAIIEPTLRPKIKIQNTSMGLKISWPKFFSNAKVQFANEVNEPWKTLETQTEEDANGYYILASIELTGSTYFRLSINEGLVP
jgi:hypothetical protein